MPERRWSRQLGVVVWVARVEAHSRRGTGRRRAWLAPTALRFTGMPRGRVKGCLARSQVDRLLTSEEKQSSQAEEKKSG